MLANSQQGERLLEILARASYTALDTKIECNYTVFKRDSIIFCMPTDHILEVVENVSIHSVPDKQGDYKNAHYRGISQYHGQICPCIGMENESTNGIKTALALSYNEHVWFLMIDSVLAVKELQAAQAAFSNIVVCDSHHLAEQLFKESA